MLRTIRAATGDRRVFRAFLGAVCVSALLQAGAVLSLYPLLAALFSDDPSSAGRWVLLVVALIAAAWGLDLFGARRGLDLGIALMRSIHRLVPRHVVDGGLRRSRDGDDEDARTRALLATGARDATSAVVLVVAPVVSSVAMLTAMAVGLLWVSPLLAAVTALGSVAAVGALWAVSRLEDRANETYAETTRALDDRLFEFAWAQPSLRTAGRTADASRWVDDAITATRARLLRLLMWQVPGQVLFSLVLQVVLLGFGLAAWRAHEDGALSATAAAASVVVLLRVIEQVMTQASSVEALVSLRQSLAQVRRAMDAPELPSPKRLGTPPALRVGDVVVRLDDGTGVLDAVTLDVAPGSLTVVVGASGSGKSTLLRVLAGLQEPTRGDVFLDGQRAEVADLRANTAMAFQDALLCAGTIRQNIDAITPGLSDERRTAIARSSGFMEVIERLPQRWDTPVGQGGGDLSGGEKQRLGLARALAKGAPILLVDEATSALDAENERGVVDALAGLKGDHTIVVVAHRPAVLQVADQVVVMDRGVVVEQGTVAELRSRGGALAGLLHHWREAAEWNIGAASELRREGDAAVAPGGA